MLAGEGVGEREGAEANYLNYDKKYIASAEVHSRTK